MLTRHVQGLIEEALRDTPVVLLNGPRQAGKSTLAGMLVEHGIMRHYVTLDDVTALGAARADPTGFLDGLPQGTVIDEVQRAPELVLPIKALVDRRRTPGRFLLTGSANALALPRLIEALAGRMELRTLWPLSQGELEGRRESFLEQLFREGAPRWRHVPPSRADLFARIGRGGFPEVVGRASPARRRAWFDGYVAALVQRDVTELARIEAVTEIPRLLKALASRSSNLVNYADVARDLSVPQTTLKRHVALLEALFLVRLVPAWFVNFGKRLAKTPKLLVTDSGLAAHLLGAHELSDEHPFAGHLAETFVANELLRQTSCFADPVTLHHFRTHVGEEVDLVLERGDGAIAGVEVKLARQVTEGDWRGLKTLAAAAGQRFRRGVVLYLGDSVVPAAANLAAVPISALWET